MNDDKYSWPGGVYFCRVCGRQEPHEHVTALSQLTDTDKLLRFIASEGDDFSLAWVSGGWVCSVRRAGYIAHYNRVIGTSKHGTAHLALRELAKLMDEDTAKNIPEPSKG
jgi:hypothetical protein